MDLAIWIKRRNVTAWVTTLLSIAVTSFASERTMVSPPLTIRPGTILNVLISQGLSSDHSQVGDVFSARLAHPVIVNGIVVAQRSQTVVGRVMEVKKAGRVSGISRLGIKLTALTAVDGQTVPIESQLLVHQGSTSVLRDSSAVAGITGLGAAIGAVSEGGNGAAIGAGIGAVTGTIGVLLTRGRPTLIDPETLLTFQVTAPATIVTNDAPQAFRFVERADYADPDLHSRLLRPQRLHRPAYLYAYPYCAPMFSPYYSYYSFPYYYGSGMAVFFAYPGGYGYGGFRHAYHLPGYPFAALTFHGSRAAPGFHNGNRY